MLFLFYWSVLIHWNVYRPFKSDEVPVKKLKEEPKSEAELKEEKAKEKKIEKQNALFHKYRSALKELAKHDLEELLEANSQEILSGKDEVCYYWYFFKYLLSKI